jgi:hypothetical protein
MIIVLSATHVNTYLRLNKINAYGTKFSRRKTKCDEQVE